MTNQQKQLVKCPKCNRIMVLRKPNGKKKFIPFYGCSGYPKCRQTVSASQYQNKQTPITPKQIKKIKDTPTTQEQQEIIEWAKNKVLFPDIYPSKSLTVNACAGSGKTTTVAKLIYWLRENGNSSVAYITFDRKSRDEGEAKNLPAQTTHQLGLKSIRQFINTHKITNVPGIKMNGKLKIDPDKTENTCLDLIGDDKNFEHKWKIWPTIKVVSNLKIYMLEPTSENIQNFLNQMVYTIPKDGSVGELIGFISHVYKIVTSDLTAVDFDDMIFLPVFYDMPVEQFDWVIGDEVQDWSGVQMELIKKAVKNYSVFVGDRNQAIYYFRGARADGMDYLKNSFQADELGLSYTFRVPKVGVELVNHLLPHIDFKNVEGAKEGSIQHWHKEDFYWGVQDGSKVVCARNAPLFKEAFHLLKLGRKAVIVGSDLKNEFDNLVVIHGQDGVKKLRENLENYMMETVEYFSEKGFGHLAEKIADKIEALLVIVDGCNTTQAVLSSLHTLFNSKEEGVIFSTVHKIKGGEAANIVVLRNDLSMPTEEDEEKLTENEYRQKLNMLYVQNTRFTDNLIFINE